MTQDEMKELRDYFDGKFEAVDRRFDGVDRRLDGVDTRFDQVDTRFDQVDTRLDQVDTRLEQEFGAITTQFVELRGYIDEAYERGSARMNVQFETLRGDMRMAREQE